MSQSTDSESEEEILVYAEFNNSQSMEQFRNINILGLDNAKPIIQLDDTFFMGNYESSLGTYMFFEEDPSVQSTDPLFDKLPEKSLKYITKTRKLLTMEHANVTLKAGKEPDHETKTADEEDDVKPANFTSINEALAAMGEFLKSDTKTDTKDDSNTEQ